MVRHSTDSFDRELGEERERRFVTACPEELKSVSIRTVTRCWRSKNVEKHTHQRQSSRHLMMMNVNINVFATFKIDLLVDFIRLDVTALGIILTACPLKTMKQTITEGTTTGTPGEKSNNLASTITSPDRVNGSQRERRTCIGRKQSALLGHVMRKGQT